MLVNQPPPPHQGEHPHQEPLKSSRTPLSRLRRVADVGARRPAWRCHPRRNQTTRHAAATTRRIPRRANPPLPRRPAANLPDLDADPAVRSAVIDLAANQRQTDEQILIVADQIADLLDAPPFDRLTTRWRTVPGSSDIYIAALHVATYGRATEFTVDAFCAAVGTSPTTAISGDGDRTRAPRKGYRPIRAYLHMWALSLISPDLAANPIRDYFNASPNRHLPITKNKFARVLWGVARSPDGFHYQPPQRRSASDEAREFPPA